MSYTLNVLIKANPQQVFYAIAERVQEWWGTTNRPVHQLGDEFTTSFRDTFWKFKITTYQPTLKIEWQCIAAKHIHQGFDGIEKEWEGTSVEWLLEENGSNQTILHFKHDGLVPELNCYEICFPAWERFVTQSLKQLVETGKGMPYLV